MIEELTNQIRESGEAVPGGSEDAFRDWLKRSAERELWFFSRWILGNEYLGLGEFHRRVVCPFLTDFETSRLKLMMLPMGHLKTTVVSRSMPLHMLIQPTRGNVYFKGQAGADTCVLLANENEDKCKENLSVSKEHLEGNPWIWWLWPHICWESPKTQARLWADKELVVPRESVRAEASIKAIGVKTGFVGSYYDAILPDDIAALEASQNPPLMERVKKWLRTIKTRRKDKTRNGSIIIGIGTHWGSADVYVDWKKDPDYEVLVKSILETDERGRDYALWPEKPEYAGREPLEAIEALRKGTDPIEWALWFMNKPVPAGFTALNWDELREYRSYDGGATLSFEEAAADTAIKQRFERTARNMGFVIAGQNRFDPANARVRLKAPQGMDNDYFEHLRSKYPERIPEAGCQK